MSKRADKEWGKAWSREAEMECGVALQILATAVWSNWYREITSKKDCPRLVGLGNIHDMWNAMHDDMKAIYTLEKLVNDTYRTKGVETETDNLGAGIPMEESEDE